jgi:pSer/pThr/pTyr-binding forkhead associated (FHA) protein
MGVPPGLPAVNPSLPVSSYRPGEIVITGRLAVRATNVSVPLPVGKNEITVGRIDPARNAFPDIDLTPYQGESAGVSRLHARLIIGVGEANSGGQLFIEDLQSTNGTLVNKQKLQAGQRFPLKNGDEIRFGRIALIYYSS